MWNKAQRWIAALALVGALVPLAIVGAGGEGRRLLALGVGERIELLTAGEEARIERALGDEYPWYRTLRRHTPADALIALDVAMDRQSFLARLHLETLLFPRRVAYYHAVQGLLAGSGPERPFYVLDLDPAHGPAAEERFVEIERGRDFVLRRLGPPGSGHPGSQDRLPFPLFAAFLLAVPLGLGAVVLTAIGLSPRHDLLGYPAWAFLAGSLALALGLFAVLFVGLGHWPLLAAAAAALGTLAALRHRRPPPPAKKGRRRRRPAGEAILWALALGACLLLTGDRMLRADGRAIIGRDEAHIWAAKAKVLYLAGGFNDTFQELTASGSIVYHRDYPLLDPLLQLASFAAASRILQIENRVPIQLFYPALILATAAALRRRVRPLLAAPLLWILLAAPVSRVLTSQALADHLVALGLVVTLDAWWRYRQSGDAAWWRLAVLALTFLAWAKNEGLMLALLVAAALALEGLRRRRKRRLVPSRGDALLLLLPLAVTGSQLLLNRFYGFTNDLVNRQLGGRLAARFADQAPEVGRHFLDKILLDPTATQLLFALFFLLLLLSPRRLVAGDLGPAAAVILAALGGYFLAYAGTPYELAWHLGTSSERLLFHLLPLTAVWVGAAAAQVLPALRCRTSRSRT